jgi:hypothetical protein
MKLTYKVKLDVPNLLRGEKVYVDGVGVMQNGTSEHLELDSSFAERLRNSYGFEVEQSKSKSTTMTAEPAALEEQSAPSEEEMEASIVSEEGGEI